ncbi:Hypothetical protein, putative [Bodo saltans]|uniref:Uncharacterized protein n=1 Tax=Bodo saltans TaxID=75058 RepID=A0A0S4JNH6_BODSA|nr:Hypothetical protein, putative [Bodo saltans]|eukprot:CUG93099.1 Hypothetical protein, putative [Bodo saltans]
MHVVSCPFLVVCCVCFEDHKEPPLEMPKSNDGDSYQSSRRLLANEDQEAMIDISHQVQELFHRLDIPIESIPIGTALPWRSFESLLVNHAVRRGGSASASSAERTQSYLHDASALNKLRQPSTIESSRAAVASSPTRRMKAAEHSTNVTFNSSKTRPSVAPLSPINVGKTKLVPLPTSARGGERKVSARDTPHHPTSPRHKRGTVHHATTAEEETAYNPAVHSLSLMLVNDSTHVPTIDSTLHDMNVAIRRMDGMTQALSLGQPFRQRLRETAIEPGVIYDPELRQIADLQRTVEILRSDVATQASTIRRLEGDLEDKRLLIMQLREDLQYYRAKDPFSGDELDGDDEEEYEDEDDEDNDNHSNDDSSEKGSPPSAALPTVSIMSPQRRTSVASNVSSAGVPRVASSPTLPPASGSGVPSSPPRGPSPLVETMLMASSPTQDDLIAGNYSFVAATSTQFESPEEPGSLTSQPAQPDAPVPISAAPTIVLEPSPSGVVRRRSGGGAGASPSFALPKKERKGFGGAAVSIKERFQNAVSKALPSAHRGPQRQPPLMRTSRGLPSSDGSAALSAVNLRSRLSISAVTAFREAVVDSITRRHIVMGFSTFEAVKRGALYEASMVDRIVSAKPQTSNEPAAQSGSAFRRVASLRRESTTMSMFPPQNASSTAEQAEKNDVAFEDALNFFTSAALRILDNPQYSGVRTTPFAQELFFLGIAFSHKALVEASLEPSVWSTASQLAMFFIESTVKDFGGYIVSDENQEYVTVFDNARSAIMCALELQFQLANTTSFTWPAELEAHPLAGATRDLSSNDKRFLWRGLRLGMYIDVVPSGNSTSVRDVCDNGGVIYNGYAARVCQWAAAHLAPAGSILLQDRMKPHIMHQMVELEDPTLEFWTWRFLPGATAPTKLFDLYHRCHTARRQEHHHTMRLLYFPLQLRVLTDADAPATLERYVNLHNQTAAKQGIKPVTREDDSILGLEGPVEQRLAKLRELPVPTSDDLARPGDEEVFLSHISMLANPPVPDGFATLPNGDVCLIVVTIPSYDDIVRFVDDALASSYARRIFRTVRELALKQEFGSLSFVRCKRDRIMYVTPEPMDAIRFALVLQDQLFQLSPWPRDGSLPPGLMAILEPRKLNGKLITEGPSVNCSLHYSKAKPMVETYSLQQAYYVGTEVSLLEHMTWNAPECTHSVYLSDTMYAVYYAREKELTLPQPFVECVGLIGRPNEPLRALYSMTPRFSVACLSIFPSACWFWYRRFVARRQLLEANSGGGGGRRGSVLGGGPGTGVEHGVLRFSPLKFTHQELRALRRYYSAADKVHRERQLLPTYTSLSSSNTITSTKTQSLCAKMFFDCSRRENRIQGSLLAAAISLATHRGRREDFVLAESVERSAMELHDTILPPVALGRDIIGPSVDFGAFVELAGMGGSTGHSAFVHLHHGSHSSMSTPKSSSHHLNRSSSSRGGIGGDQPRRLLQPQPLTLGGGQNVQSPREIVGETPADGSIDNHEVRALYEIDIDNHEVRALYEIDKERQFMVQRSKKIESEVRVAHQAVSHFVHNMEGYISQLLSTQAKRVSDEEFILLFMRKIHDVRAQSKKQLDSEDDASTTIGDEGDDSKDGSDSDDEEDTAKKRSNDEEAAFQMNFEKVRVNETWQDSLAGVVEQDADGADYDPVLLCRSMVGLLCRHFLSLRTVSRRMQRVNDSLERAQRTMDPNTRIGKAVELVSESDMQRREVELATSAEQASRVMQLGAIEESNIGEAMSKSMHRSTRRKEDDDED